MLLLMGNKRSWRGITESEKQGQDDPQKNLRSHDLTTFSIVSAIKGGGNFPSESRRRAGRSSRMDNTMVCAALSHAMLSWYASKIIRYMINTFDSIGLARRCPRSADRLVDNWRCVQRLVVSQHKRSPKPSATCPLGEIIVAQN